MTDILAASSQMAMSLAFHIIFCCVGIAMPPLMVVAECLYRRTGDHVYLLLGRRWATVHFAFKLSLAPASRWRVSDSGGRCRGGGEAPSSTRFGSCAR
jgi:cytochrome bd-type quinol oxidase subunit 1